MSAKVHLQIIADLDEDGITVDIIERIAPSATEQRELLGLLNSKDKAALTAGTAESHAFELCGGPEQFVATLEVRALESFGAERKSGPETGTERLLIKGISAEYPRRRILDREEAMQILEYYVEHQAMHPGFRWVQLTVEDMVAASGGVLDDDDQDPLPVTTVSPNSEFGLDAFWEITERARKRGGRDIEDRIDALREVLEEFDVPDLLAFDAHFTAQFDLAYSHDLWGAAYVMQGGCSDDGFADFRSALISMGRKVFERALCDPDSVADLPDHEADNLYAEGFQYVAAQVLQETHGTRAQRSQVHPEKPKGMPWGEDNHEELQARWPKTFARFWES